MTVDGTGQIVDSQSGSDYSRSQVSASNDIDGDLWSALNDIDFQIELDGRVYPSDPDNLAFCGNLTLRVKDTWTFGNIATAHRMPFEHFEFLDERYRYMTEQRFFELETRGWVKPFRVEGERKSAYRIVVSETVSEDGVMS